MATSETLRPWSLLPVELLSLISRNLSGVVSDYIAFRCVCSSWRSSAPLPPQRPWLLLPHDPSTSLRSFFNPATGNLSFLDFPETLNKHVCGSAHGWLALVADDSSLSLWNPITRSEIPLPPPIHCPVFVEDGRAWKVFFSSDPNDAGCLVVVTLSESLDFVYCRIGDEAWTVLDDVFSCPVASIAFGKGRVFAVDMDGDLAILDLYNGCIGRSSAPLSLVQTHEGVDRAVHLHLLNADAELFLVRSLTFHVRSALVKWLAMEIFRFDLNGESGELSWSRVRSIGDLAFFLSGNHSSVIHAGNVSGCKWDCVYVSDRCYGVTKPHLGVHQLLIYNVKGSNNETLSCPWKGTGKELKNSTWFTPAFQ